MVPKCYMIGKLDILIDFLKQILCFLIIKLSIVHTTFTILRRRMHGAKSLAWQEVYVSSDDFTIESLTDFVNLLLYKIIK